MAEWQSIEELVRDLRLSADPKQSDAVAKEIRRNLSLLHPDKNGGAFVTDADRDTYDRLNRALEFVREGGGGEENAVTIKKDDLPDLLKLFREIAKRPPTVDPAALRNSCRADVRSETKARYSIRLKASGVFAAVTGALMTFSGVLKDNPVFGPVFQTTFARGALIAAFVGSIALWLLTEFVKRREEALTDYLLSESGRREILRHTLPFPQEDTPKVVHFRSLDIAERLRWIERERLGLFQGRRLSRRFKLPEIAVGWLSDVDLEKIARVIITELEAQGVAERVVEKRVVPRFAIARSVLEELWKD
jgi:hypothetical protein